MKPKLFYVILFGFVLISWSYAEKAQGPKSLATVNGKEITEKDVEFSLEGLAPEQKKNIIGDRHSRSQVLMSLIDQELLIKKAEEKKMDQTPEFTSAVTAFKKRLLSEMVLQKELGSKVTPKELKKYYENNKIRYSTDAYHVWHILVSDATRAKEIYKKAKVAATDFQALAEKVSEDPSAKNNRGDLGYVDIHSPFVAEFKDAIIGSSKGKLIGPLKTAFGYHVIKIVDKKFGHPLGYDEVELLVQNEFKKELRENYIDELRQKAKIHWSKP